MSLCSVDDVRAKIYIPSTSPITNTTISSMIDDISEEILELAGTTSETDSNLRFAAKYSVCAAVLRMMKTTGEMASRVTSDDWTQQNQIDTEIKYYEDQSKKFLNRYLGVECLIVSGRMGYKTVNNVE